MAPRGRPAQRQTRMHAAVDAMSTYGFDTKYVQKTVNSLLKTYGGPEGWPFIEADAYKVLLEKILEEQEEEIKGREEDEADGHVSLAASDEAGPSSVPGAEDAEDATLTIETGMNGAEDAAPATLRIERGMNGIALSRNSTDAAANAGPNAAAAGHMEAGGSTLTSASPASGRTLTSASPASGSSRVTQPPRVRRPLNGWVSDSDDEDKKEFINLIPLTDPTAARIDRNLKRNRGN